MARQELLKEVGEYKNRLLNIYKELEADQNLKLATQRFSRWKSMVIKFLKERVSDAEAQQFDDSGICVVSLEKNPTINFRKNYFDDAMSKIISLEETIKSDEIMH